MRRGLSVLALLMAVLLAIAPAGAASSGPGLDFSDDRAPNQYVHEDVLTVAEHDMGTMDELTDYSDDQGNVAELPAVVNQSQDERLGFRADKLTIDAMKQFPRVSGESENKQTWLNASNWTTSTSDATNVTPSLTDADGMTATGVDAVQFSTTGMGAGDTATASFGQGVSVSSDVTKRVLQVTGQVNDLTGDVEVRLVDSGGGYWYANASTGANSSLDSAIANATGNGYVFQERVSNLQKSGTPDSIDSVEIVALDANVDVVVTGLDVERKSTFELGEVSHDFDGDGTEEKRTISEINNDPSQPGPGVVKYTTRAALGAELSSASIHDLEVYNVRYEAAQLTDAADYSVEFSEASEYGSYPDKLETHYRLNVPTAIDLAHGVLTLRDEQGMVDQRYATVEIATATGDTTFENASWTDKSSLYTSKGATHDLATGLSAGTNYMVHMVVLLQDGEADALQSTSAISGGPTGSSGGFFSTIFGKIAAFGGMIVGAVGLKRVFGGG